MLIAGKDLRRSVRDRSAIMTAVVAPLVLAFILSSVLGDASTTLNAEFAVVDQDGGEVSQRFVGQVLESLTEQGVTITEVDSPDEARRMAEDGEVAAAFVLPSGLSDAVQSFQEAEITIIANPESSVGVQIAESVAGGFAAELNSVRLSISTVLAGRGEPATVETVQELQSEAVSSSTPVGVEEQAAGSRQFDGNTFFAAGISVFFLFFTAQIGAVSLLQERKEGTLARLVAAPVARSSVVGAKAIYSFVLGALSMAILIVASHFLMSARWGDPLAVAVLVLSAVFAAMGLQSLVTTLAKTDEQAAGYGAIVGVTLGMLGGTFFPLSQAPGLMAQLSFVAPHAWIMDGLGELSGGAGTLADVLPAIAALLLFGMITGALAFVRSRSLVVA